MAYTYRMLSEFLTSNRNELISRCRQKVVDRFAPSEVPPTSEHGAPVLLTQIAEMLRCEQHTESREVKSSQPTPAPTEIGRAAALHGVELSRLGYSIDQVVHDYGDVCQAVTELAADQQAPISVDEFRTFNRCLDNAIADAATSFGGARQTHVDGQAQTLRERLKKYNDEHRRLVGIAINSFDAINSGSVGINGATAILHLHALAELRTLAERSLPEIVLLSEATTVTSR